MIHRRLLGHALGHCLRHTERRAPDKIIGEGYLLRWHLIPRNRGFRARRAGV